MRDSRIRLMWLVALVLASVLAPISLWAASKPPTTIWATYHGDMLRRGINSDSKDIGNPASLNLIWVFPRAEEDAVQSETAYIVDNTDPIALFKSAGWTGDYDKEAWNNTASPYDYYWAPAVTSNGGGPFAKATWFFPESGTRAPAETLPRGYYQIWVWVPPNPPVNLNDPNSPAYTFTKKATYHVFSAQGDTTITFDQSNGGTWQPLSIKPFFFDAKMNHRVELTNVTADATSPKIRVAADAIRFSPVTGQEIYSSPTSAMVDFGVALKSGSKGPSQVPAVFTGTVEPPFGSSTSSPDSGAVYCINSVTPNTSAFDSSDDNKELAEYLGTPMWRYPRNFEKMDAGEVTSFLKETNHELEGPIEGGVFSSPTLAHVSLPIAGVNTDYCMCLVTGMDRQVYGLNAAPNLPPGEGRLLWKGPGITLSEKPNWTTEPAVSSGKLRNDAFGGQYQYTKCGTGSPMVWNFGPDISKTGMNSGDGRSYTVYAWIPLAKGGEITDGYTRIPDAEYTISYSGGDTKIKINQGVPTTLQPNPLNLGRWVSLGSYFGVTEVSLDTSTSEADPSTRCVVADAMMIVPDTIGSFSYCSPSTDAKMDLEDYNSSTPEKSQFAYVSTATEGRLICFDLEESLSNAKNKDVIGRVSWIYPAIRDSYKMTNPNTGAGGDQPSLGEVGASPTFYKGASRNMVYIPTLNGTIHCVDAASGAKLATYADGTASSGDPTTPGSGDVTGTPGFTSSINVGEMSGNKHALFVGSVQGTFYALDPEPAGSTLNLLKKYQSDMPLGAFRFSTPSTVNVNSGDYRVWAPSSDGHIYALNATSSGSADFLQRLDKTTTTGFVEPSVLAPIQGSPAFDGGKSSPPLSGSSTKTMYIGDMNGVLHWFDANTGTSPWTFNPDQLDPTDTGGAENFTGYQCDGALFSSPNITRFTLPSTSGGTASYVYVGGADGRIYAFSQWGGAWGGFWAGGRWPFNHSHANDKRGNSTTLTSPNTDVQAELFNLPFYDNSDPGKNEANPIDSSGNHLATPVAGGSWATDWIVSPDMKLPDPKTPFPASSAGVKARNDAIDNYLTEEAKNRRQNDYVFPNGADRASKSKDPIYFEWGETLNVIIWNLPAVEFMSGQTIQSAASNIVFSLANTSPGASAGSLIRQTGRVTLKEYTVLDRTKPVKGVAGAYEVMKYSVSDVKRCYALAQIYLDPKRNPCFSPGSGWTLVVEVKRKRTNDPADPLITQRIPIANLTLNSGRYEPQFDQEQLFGINNPLAIRDDQDRIGAGYYSDVAWPTLSINNPFKNTKETRKDSEAHFNGNAALTEDADGNSVYGAGKVPFINMQYVNHGSASREAWLGVVDRSATGTKITGMLAGVPQVNKLDNFRIDNPDLRWSGGSDAIGNSGGVWFPWEYGPGSTDYPNIYRQRQEFRKGSDDGLPTETRTTLPPVVGGIPAGKTIGSYDDSTLQPETVYASVDVPRFQPANFRKTSNGNGPMEQEFIDAGYQRTMSAFLDSNGDGNLDRGDNVLGRPSISQEVYRQFKVGVMVPPDPKIEVEESIIDVGRPPHGLGEQLTGFQGFSPYNPKPEIAQWFKPVTIKNAGNVNFRNMTIGRNVYLFSDQSSPVAPIPMGEITSSLDSADSFLPLFKQAPYTSAMANGAFLGYTLTKARVGEPDPTQMTVPDKRKWDLDFEQTRTKAQAAWTDLTKFSTGVAKTLDNPLPVQVSVKVPLTQPIGTYQSFDKSYNLPYVPVFTDLNGDGVLEANSEPVAQKSFQLKVTVRETQLTDGVTPTSLPQIDNGILQKFANGMPIRYGDSTPAAYRDPTTGKVFLVWSSNRVLAPPEVARLLPEDWANAPWLLSYATLGWNKTWSPVVDDYGRWWHTQAWSDNTATPYLPSFGWPSTLLGNYASWKVMPWSANTALPSVRHHSPVFAQYGPDNSKAWLAWVGTADIVDPVTNKISQENRIFYTDASNCNVSSSETGIFAIEHDPAMAKRFPSMAIENSAQATPKRMWMFWQGGDEGRWGLYCSANSTPANTGTWTPDMKLMVADCLTSVSSPNAILRYLWDANQASAKKMFDVVYSGTTKLGQTSDIMMSRYAAVTDKDVTSDMKDELPSNKAQPMPRVFGERLERDSKYGFYTSRHLAWIRPSRSDKAIPDNWGGYDINADPKVANPDLPYIRVHLPEGYPIPGGTDRTSNQIAISGTDGSVWERATDADAWSKVSDALDITPEIDDASGLYVYKYPAGSEAHKYLGDMMVDYSSGIVRFTQQLAELRSGDKFISANVYADYTPRTWRLTTDKAVDNSPKAFIEKTNMSCYTDPKKLSTNPGLGDDWKTPNGVPGGSQPVDRMWVFWRKAAAGAQSSTIYFSTYRVGVELSDLFRRNGKRMDPSNRYSITSVENALGPWEIDGSGNKVYFTQIDERYRSLEKNGSPFYSGGPSPIKIHYKWTSSTNSGTDTLVAYDVFWQPELPEQSLLGFSSDGNVNEGSIYAFADPIADPSQVGVPSGTFLPAFSSKIWLFWTSTRGGTSDLFWETISPEFAVR